MDLANFLKSLSLKQKFNQGVVWNIASMVVLGLSGIALNIIITTLKGPAPLGVFNQVFAYYIFLSQISVGGIHFSVLKHVSWHQKDSDLCSTVVVSGAVISAVLSLIVAVLAFLGREYAGQFQNSPGVAIGLGLIAPGLVAFALNKVLLNVLNGLNRMKSYAIFQAGRFLLILVGVVVICLLPVSPDYLAAAYTFAEFTLLLLLIVFIQIKVVPLRLSGIRFQWFREHLSFGFRGFFSGALAEINTRIDVLILGHFADDTTVGIYSFAAMIAEGFSLLAVAVRRNVDPLLGESFASGDWQRISDYAKKIRRTFYPIMLVVGMVAVAVYPLGLKIFVADPAYAVSHYVFLIWMIGVVINSGYRPFLGIVLQGGRPGMHTMLVSMLVLVHVLMNFMLIPLIGMFGAATASATNLVLEAVLIIIFSRKLFKINL